MIKEIDSADKDIDYAFSQTDEFDNYDKNISETPKKLKERQHVSSNTENVKKEVNTYGKQVERQEKRK